VIQVQQRMGQIVTRTIEEEKGLCITNKVLYL